MKVSIIICSYGLERLNDVIEVVDSIENQTYNNYEIIIIIDENETFYKKLRNSLPSAVIIIESKEKGLSNARNAGVKRATGDIIAFIDDDATADKNWLRWLLNNYKNENIIGVGGKIKPSWEGGKPNWFPEALNWIVGCTYIGHPNYKCKVRNLIGCNMSFKREIFKKVGLFQKEIGRVGKKLYSGEEMEFCVRAINKYPDASIIYEPKAIVYHKVPKKRQTLKYAIKRALNEGISKAQIKKIVEKDNNKLLSTEHKYLISILRGNVFNENKIKNKNIISYFIQYIVLWVLIFTVTTAYYLELHLSG